MKTSRKLHSLLAMAATSAVFLAVIGSMATAVAAQTTPVTQDGACVVFGTSTDTQAVDDETQDSATNPAASATEQAAGAADAETADQPGAAAAPETDQTQDPSYTASIAVDQAAMDKLSAADKCAALSKLATVTPDQVKAAVEKTGGVVDSIELDEVNGFLVYSVQRHDGTDVKVDAGNATILNTQAAGSDTDADTGTNDGENSSQ